MDIVIKRVYEEPCAADGVRILVDRIWPRGLSKEKAHLDDWLKQLAPSTELREWFAHDPARWAAFKEQYHAQITQSKTILAAVQQVRDLAKDQRVTLLYAAKDCEHNNALALKLYLDKTAKSTRG